MFLRIFVHAFEETVYNEKGKREGEGQRMSMRFTFWIMVGIVAISGLSQGMLLPAIAMIFEQEGVSSSINGIHATALYIGILVISPFLENRCKGLE